MLELPLGTPVARRDVGEIGADALAAKLRRLIEEVIGCHAAALAVALEVGWRWAHLLAVADDAAIGAIDVRALRRKAGAGDWIKIVDLSGSMPTAR